MKPLKFLWLCLVCHVAVAQTLDPTFANNGIRVIENLECLESTIQGSRFILKDEYGDLKGYTLNGVEDFNFGNSGSISSFDNLAPNFYNEGGGIAANEQYSLQVQKGYFFSAPNNYKLIIGLYDQDGQLSDTLNANTNLLASWPLSNIAFSGDLSKSYICFKEYGPPPINADSLYILSVNQNATLNSSWGTNGRAVINLAQHISGFQSYMNITKIIPAQDGVYIAIQIIEQSTSYTGVIKLNNSGAFDTNFGVKNLHQILNLNVAIIDIAFSDDAVFVLSTNNKIYKLNKSDFTIDTGFGTNGKINPSEPNGEYFWVKIIDNKLYGIGRVVASNHYKPLLSRFSLSSGSNDNTFGVNGSLLFTDPQFLDEYNFRDIIPYTANSFFVVGDSYLDSGSGSGNYDDTFILKYIANATGIDENSISAPLIYPNPATQNLYIKGDNVNSIFIYNMQGAVVFQDAAKSQNQIDIGNLPSGLYTVVISNSKGTYKTRITKQ